jgi:NADPH:quinone reductase-like Zn-dependent oxidoreductase
VRVIQMTKHGGPEVLHFVEVPDPKPGPGEVLLKVDAAAADFSGLMRRCGDVYPVPTPLPFVPRAEVASTVAHPGDGVDPGSARPAAHPLLLADAGEARRLMEAAAIAGKVVLKP